MRVSNNRILFFGVNYALVKLNSKLRLVKRYKSLFIVCLLKYIK